MPKVSESIEIKATTKQCYDIIWDYAKYPDFVSGVSSIQIPKKKKNALEVVFGLNLIKKITYTVAVTGKPNTQIDWHLLEGNVFKKIIGRWDLEEIKKGITLATYSLDLEFNLFLPSPIAKALIGSNLPVMLKSFKARIEAYKS